MRDLYDPTGTELAEQAETEGTHMFVAQLSALDLGAYLEIKGVKKGSKYESYYDGVLTEVKHDNTGTMIRLDIFLAGSASKESKESAVRTGRGVAMTFPHGIEVLEYVEPPS